MAHVITRFATEFTILISSFVFLCTNDGNTVSVNGLYMYTKQNTKYKNLSEKNSKKGM